MSAQSKSAVDTISHYQLLDIVGKGGMGVVYRAKDLRLGRTVALKLLAADSEPAGQQQLARRLEQEAITISRLSHPNICSLFDFGIDSGRIFLVMEFLEGQTLAQRIQAGPIPFRECLRISVQIAAALQHAHSQRVVHRDLKPGNIMLTPHGVKLLDFGLARQDKEAQTVGDDTIDLGPQADLTQPGMVIGSYPYLPPEQLRGKPTDARSDIFSFGIVMYEMSCGERPFGGATAADLGASLLREDPPPMARFRPDLPTSWERLVNRALAKDPGDRWQGACDLQEAIELVGAGDSSHSILQSSSVANQSAPVDLRASALRWLKPVSGVLALLGLCGLAYLAGRQQPATGTRPGVPVHFMFNSPGKYGFALAVDSGGSAFSPDGRQLVFVLAGERPSRLWLRPMDATDAKPLRGTEGAFSPFWSPDGGQIAFFAEGALKRLRLSDGSVAKVADAAQGRGGTWMADGTILFTPADVGGTKENPQSVLHKVSSDGGAPQRVGSLNTARGENGQVWPFALPGRNRYLYLSRTNKPETQALFVGTIDGSEPPRLLRPMQSNAQFLEQPSGSGRGILLFVQDGNLMAQAFDANRLAMSGDPQMVAEKVGYVAPERLGFFSVSTSGALLYSAAQSESRNISLVRRDGTLIRNYPQVSSYYSPRLSRDGKNLFVSRFTEFSTNADLWFGPILERESLQRFTFEDSHEASPIWSPDGTEVAYSEIDTSIFQLKRRNLRTGAAAVAITDKTPSVMRPYDWSRDGRLLIYGKSDGRNRTDIWAVDLANGNKSYPITQTPANELHAQLSPDGKWLAYASDASGAYEIYIERLGNPLARAQVSTTGGIMPRWRDNGKELYYLTLKDDLIAVPMQIEGESPRIGPANRLFSAPLASRQRMSFTYDAAPDGSWFVLLTPVETPEQREMHVLLNWADKLAPR